MQTVNVCRTGNGHEQRPNLTRLSSNNKILTLTMFNPN